MHEWCFPKDLAMPSGTIYHPDWLKWNRCEIWVHHSAQIVRIYFLLNSEDFIHSPPSDYEDGIISVWRLRTSLLKIIFQWAQCSLLSNMLWFFRLPRWNCRRSDGNVTSIRKNRKWTRRRWACRRSPRLRWRIVHEGPSCQVVSSFPWWQYSILQDRALVLNISFTNKNRTLCVRLCTLETSFEG